MKKAVKKIIKKNNFFLLILSFFVILFLGFVGNNIYSIYKDTIYIKDIEEKNLIRFEEFKNNIDLNKTDLVIGENTEVYKNIENIFEITGIGKKNINNNFNEYLEIFGNNLNGISNILIKCNGKADSFDIVKRDVNKNIDFNGKDRVSIFIKENTLESGSCLVGTEIAGIWIFSDFSINVEHDGGGNSVFNLKFITPNFVNKDDGGIIVLQGKGFLNLVAIQIDNGIVLDLEFLEIINDNVVIVNIPKNMKIGEYFFRFLSKEGVYENRGLKIFVK